jgi:phage terminase Nu1 subunit (DNA packaging protein)
MNLFAEPRWSNAELAEVFGISAQRLGVLCKQGVLPLPEEGLHEPKKVVAAYVQHLKRKEEGASQAGESIRKVQLENEMRSLKLKRIAGELVPTERVQKDWFESARRVRDGLLNLPSRLSGVFAAESSQEKIYELFTKEVHAVLTELSSGQAEPRNLPLLPLENGTPTAPTQPDGAMDQPLMTMLAEPEGEQGSETTRDEEPADVGRLAEPPDRLSTGD